MTRIALFGTSADPPTAGHQEILSWLSQHFDQVVVWASDNPFKSNQTDLKYRTEMLQVLIDEIHSVHQNIELHPELSHRYTVETLRGAKHYWPDAEFTLVIGADLVKQIMRWYRVEEILRQVNLLIVPRPGYEMNLEDLTQLQEIGGGVAIASMMGLPVSSTDYREERNMDAVTGQVRQYISQKGLYAHTSQVQESVT
ncbi:MAG: nicotinate-nucleotide adenylyltransferase [Microcoleaceae cyanobacterium]